MPVLLENSVQAGTNGATTQSVTLNLGTNPDRGVAAWIGCANAASPVTDVRLDGTSVISALGASTSYGGLLWYPLGIATTLSGSKVLAADWSLGGFVVILAAAVSGVDQVTPFPVISPRATSNDDPLAWSLAAATGDLLLALIQHNDGLTLTPDAGTSALAGIAGGNPFRWGLVKAATGNPTVIGGDWPSTPTSTFACAFVARAAAAGSGAALPPPGLFVSQAAGRASLY